MRVLAAMSGGVDSSVAAARLLDAGHDVVGATMKLWGGTSDSGCCSVADVEDARRVAQQLGIIHHVFNFSADFDARVVDPYVEAHRRGRTPNPCIECNRHLKFDRLLQRARQLGFDAVATGHHARVIRDRRWRLLRGADRAKDQSYVLHMLRQDELAQCLFPVGEMTKAEVRAEAAARRLRTAAKPDSQDVCFVLAGGGGRRGFLSDRMPMHPARVVDHHTGATVGQVDAVELVTVGQRRGLGGTGRVRYAVEVDVDRRQVRVGGPDDLLSDAVAVDSWTWVGPSFDAGSVLDVQTSAHGAATPARLDRQGVSFVTPQRRVAPGQSVVLYRDDEVVGGGIAA